ncbi:hypothetical protein EHS39_33060 [Ensifer sp. MPMI2T]|nr:hypothetical protein EHS39_33060 [Ensifer sp. MPMI2T]
MPIDDKRISQLVKEIIAGYEAGYSDGSLNGLVKDVLAPKQPDKFRDRDQFNTIQIEAALCAWEWMCENREHDLLKEFFDRLGSSGMRHCSMQAGDIAARVHDHVTAQGYEFINAYDWEFVPEVLRRLDWRALTEDNQYGGPPYEPGIAAIFVTMLAADKARTADPDQRDFQKQS